MVQELGVQQRQIEAVRAKGRVRTAGEEREREWRQPPRPRETEMLALLIGRTKKRLLDPVETTGCALASLCMFS